MMRLNDDLTRPLIVPASRQEWVASPAAGVERRMLFRVGDEIARATSIVRYAPGSIFPRHVHGGGEEILVLDGVFQDEHGDYPAGSYLRNPPGTSHKPASCEGCTIFVRLWQFRGDDGVQVACRSGDGRNIGPRPGATAATVLFDDGQEEIRIEDWAEGARVTVENGRGLEFLVLSGTLRVGDERLDPQSWGRLPAGVHLDVQVGPKGARIWMRGGALLHQGVRQLPES